TGSSPEEVWASPQAILLLQGVQVVTVLVGALFAGVGQPRGPLLGATIGIFNGLFLILFRRLGTPTSVVALYGLPLLHAFFGLVGGMIGSSVWKPLPTDPVPQGLKPKKKVARRPRVSPLAGPVSWVRVMVGTGLAVAGTLCAALIFQKVTAVSGGRLGTTD